MLLLLLMRRNWRRHGPGIRCRCVCWIVVCLRRRIHWHLRDRHEILWRKPVREQRAGVRVPTRFWPVAFERLAWRNRSGERVRRHSGLLALESLLRRLLGVMLSGSQREEVR